MSKPQSLKEWVKENVSLQRQIESRLESLATEYIYTVGAGTADQLRRVYAEEAVRQMEFTRRVAPHANMLMIAPPEWKP